MIIAMRAEAILVAMQLALSYSSSALSNGNAIEFKAVHQLMSTNDKCDIFLISMESSLDFLDNVLAPRQAFELSSIFKCQCNFRTNR